MFVWSEFYCDIQKGLLVCKGNLHVPWCRVWDTNTFTCWVAVGTPLKEKPQACCTLLSVNVFLFSLLDWAADPSILKMRLSLAISFFIFLSLWVEEACSKEKSSKKGKGKKKQYLCPSYVPQTLYPSAEPCCCCLLTVSLTTKMPDLDTVHIQLWPIVSW